jgi:hypothetical protein
VRNSGHRIFSTKTAGPSTIGWTLIAAPQDFKITDCDGTLDNDANVVVDETLRVWVMVRLVGPKNSALDLTCTEVIEAGADDLCAIGTETITKGNSFTKIMKNLVDNQLEEVTWTLNNSLNAKVLQVWIFELL